jgi:hypothetical protein
LPFRAAASSAALSLALASVLPARPAWAEDERPPETPAEATAFKNQCADAYEATQRQRASGSLISAHRSSIFCAQSRCPAVLRNDCATWAGELSARIPSLVIEAVSSSGETITEVAVTLDGKLFSERLDGRAREVDPGQHRFRFEAAGLPSTEGDFVVVEGTKVQRLNVTVGSAPEKAPPKPRKLPLGAFVWAGIGVVGLSSFVYFGLKGNARKDDLAGCKPACDGSLRTPIERDYLAADASLGVALVSLGLSSWLAVESQSAERQALDLDLGSRGGLVRYRRAF